jgi:hypothetical protein
VTCGYSPSYQAERLSSSQQVLKLQQQHDVSQVLLQQQLHTNTEQIDRQRQRIVELETQVNKMTSISNNLNCSKLFSAFFKHKRSCNTHLVQIAIANGVYRPSNSVKFVMHPQSTQQQQGEQHQQQRAKINEAELHRLREEHALLISFLCLIARRMHNIAPIDKVFVRCIITRVFGCIFTSDALWLLGVRPQMVCVIAYV